jgi:hypothetical protein
MCYTLSGTSNGVGLVKKFADLDRAAEYVEEHLYNIQCSEIFTLRNEKLHTEA